MASSFGYPRHVWDQPRHLAIANHRCSTADGYWAVLEQRLADAGPWLMGETYSALDPYCFMLTLWGKPSEEAFRERFPNVARLATQVRDRPKLKAVLQSHGVLDVGGYGS